MRYSEYFKTEVINDFKTCHIIKLYVKKMALNVEQVKVV